MFFIQAPTFLIPVIRLVPSRGSYGRMNAFYSGAHVACLGDALKFSIHTLKVNEPPLFYPPK